MVKKVVEVLLPEYNLKSKPDYVKIGKKVDGVIVKKFPDGKYIIRAIGSQDHSNYKIEDLINVILKKGTDKYDPKKKGVCHDAFCEYDYDIQANSFEIKDGKILLDKANKFPSLFGDIVYNFYENAPGDRGYPVKIDLLLIYDFESLEKARLVNPDIKRNRPGWDKHLYKFKHPKNKKEALVGIVKIKC